MKNNLPQHILWILMLFKEHNKEAFLIGGCVRDMLMHRPIHDFDITTNALPKETMTIFQKQGCRVIPTGMKHGTITVIIENAHVEITTYRIEHAYVNHRSPSDVSFTSNLYEDLKRRDFTMNAIAYHPDLGIIDPYHGEKDIQNKIIRAVCDPAKRFKEDALRIMRAIRFQATLHFVIEKETYKALQQSLPFITYISKERIRDEFNKILLGDMQNTLTTLRRYGVLPYILPGYEILYDHKQATPWHLYDVFTHTDIALNYTNKKSLACKLAIVFHDLGKPEKETFDDQGRAHYKQHAVVSCEKALILMKYLKYDKALIERVHTLILYHDYYLTEKKATLRRYLTKFNNDIDFALEGLTVQIADDMAKNMERSRPKIDVINRCIPILQQIAKEETLPSLKSLQINGKDLMALGYSGKTIGTILQDLLQLIIDHPAYNKKNTLINYIKCQYNPNKRNF